MAAPSPSTSGATQSATACTGAGALPIAIPNPAYFSLYGTNRDLPVNIQDRLPESAQDLYRIAFNCALHWYSEEDKAHRTARSAVRNQAANLNRSLYTSQP